MLDRIRIILVRPDSGGNVGAACRAMKTMGISRLVLVGNSNPDIERVRTLAIHAFDLFEKRQHYETLDEALNGSVFSAGITRRRGRFRKYFSLLPDEAAARIADIREGDVSLVFGNERTGLTDEELNACDAAVHIPSSPDFPSLNLSHAVQVITYSLYRTARGSEGKYTPVPREILNDTAEHMVNCLESIGFFSLTGKEEMKHFFRDLLARAAPDSREAARMKGIFTKIEGLKQNRQTNESSV